MSCEHLDLPDGTTAIVCRRGVRVPRCQTPGCGRAASFECDHPTKRGTCSRRMCDRCRHPVDEGVDYCPPHARQLAHPALR